MSDNPRQPLPPHHLDVLPSQPVSIPILPSSSPRALAYALPARSPSLRQGHISSSIGRDSINLGESRELPDPEEWTHWGVQQGGKLFAAEDLLKVVDSSADSDRDASVASLVDISSDQTVEKAVVLMLTSKSTCLAVYEQTDDRRKYIGLFDYADLNAFLLLAVNSHTFRLDAENVRIREIVARGKEAGDVTVGLACNLSEKDPLVTLPRNASLLDLLKIFSRGTHRVLLMELDNPDVPVGMVSDRQLVRWFMDTAYSHPTIQQTLQTPLNELPVFRWCTPPTTPSPGPSGHIAPVTPVVSCTSDETILDAMSIMSKEGVSSVAVVDPTTGFLLSAVSVTDIGKIVAPSQNKRILSTPLSQFIAQIKNPDGSTDGVDKYPVFSVLDINTLGYTMQKLLATNAHRVFITEDMYNNASALSLVPGANLRGVVSMVDVLSIFARLAHITDVDPGRMTRHRRASSIASNSSSTSGGRSSRRSSWVGAPGINLSSSAGSPAATNSGGITGSRARSGSGSGSALFAAGFGTAKLGRSLSISKVEKERERAAVLAMSQSTPSFGG
ncbi:cell separation during budding [Tulasnella sp. 418]|nr:cell separation during budding [Tulasnella sp. 418]